MDLGFILFSVCVMMISPLGDVRCSAGDAIDCPCPAIPSVNRTQPPPETCFQIDSHFRYNCTKGYVRKAGTSNLIKCQNTGGVAKWTEATLQCIHAIDCPCPAIPPMNLTQPPPETCFQIDSRFRYDCAKGYVRKAGTSNLIKCQKEKNGKVAKWTECSLQCIPDPKITPRPPVEQGHTDIPPVSTIATTVTAATTSLQTTQSISTSASVTAETGSTEPTSSGLQVLSVTTQAAATTSLQMTQSISTSASVTAETGSTEPTSSGLQVLSVTTQAGNVTETKPMVGTSPASTTAVPSQRSTVEPHMHELTSNITRISIVSLVVVFACAGISFYCYKRRTKNMIPVRTSEEDVPMDDIQSQNRVCSQPATAAESSRLNGDQDCGV